MSIWPQYMYNINASVCHTTVTIAMLWASPLVTVLGFKIVCGHVSGPLLHWGCGSVLHIHSHGAHNTTWTRYTLLNRFTLNCKISIYYTSYSFVVFIGPLYTPRNVGMYLPLCQFGIHPSIYMSVFFHTFFVYSIFTRNTIRDVILKLFIYINLIEKQGAQKPQLTVLNSKLLLYVFLIFTVCLQKHEILTWNAQFKVPPLAGIQ